MTENLPSSFYILLVLLQSVVPVLQVFNCQDSLNLCKLTQFNRDWFIFENYTLH